jgi:integrase/recombinase XerD
MKTYSAGVTAFLRWCESTGTTPELTKVNVQAFLADLLDGGAEGATAHVRHKALKRLAVWLTEAGELDTNPLLGSKPPCPPRRRHRRRGYRPAGPQCRRGDDDDSRTR